MQDEKHLTDEQMERVYLAIQALAKQGNAWGIGITRQLEGKNAAEKRRIALGAVGQMWNAMLSIRMAMSSTEPVATIKQRLKV